ncbi:hypothetical protein [Salininema proteolyticum]|uniref:DUF3352 domain-containing protein n=1 Tax=Salininema proteolyticum TaxID=1607685 RepID=A0ABV8TZ24_9ACTN
MSREPLNPHDENPEEPKREDDAAGDPPPAEPSEGIGGEPASAPRMEGPEGEAPAAEPVPDSGEATPETPTPAPIEGPPAETPAQSPVVDAPPTAPPGVTVTPLRGEAPPPVPAKRKNTAAIAILATVGAIVLGGGGYVLWDKVLNVFDPADRLPADTAAYIGFDPAADEEQAKRLLSHMESVDETSKGEAGLAEGFLENFGLQFDAEEEVLPWLGHSHASAMWEYEDDMYEVAVLETTDAEASDQVLAEEVEDGYRSPQDLSYSADGNSVVIVQGEANVGDAEAALEALEKAAEESPLADDGAFADAVEKYDGSVLFGQVHAERIASAVPDFEEMEDSFKGTLTFGVTATADGLDIRADQTGADPAIDVDGDVMEALSELPSTGLAASISLPEGLADAASDAASEQIDTMEEGEEIAVGPQYFELCVDEPATEADLERFSDLNLKFFNDRELPPEEEQEYNDLMHQYVNCGTTVATEDLDEIFVPCTGEALDVAEYNRFTDLYWSDFENLTSAEEDEIDRLWTDYVTCGVVGDDATSLDKAELKERMEEGMSHFEGGRLDFAYGYAEEQADTFFARLQVLDGEGLLGFLSDLLGEELPDTDSLTLDRTELSYDGGEGTATMSTVGEPDRTLADNEAFASFAEAVDFEAGAAAWINSDLLDTDVDTKVTVGLAAASEEGEGKLFIRVNIGG